VDVAIASQQRGKQVSAATNKHTTIEELLEVVFSMRPILRLYNEDQMGFGSQHLEVGVGS
jgi:hypothetical protein